MKHLREPIETIYEGHGRKFDYAERDYLGKWWKGQEGRKPKTQTEEEKKQWEEQREAEILDLARGRCEGITANEQATRRRFAPGSSPLAGRSGDVDLSPGEVGETQPVATTGDQDRI